METRVATTETAPYYFEASALLFKGPKPLEDMLQVLLWDLLILVMSKRVQLNWLLTFPLE